MLKLQLVADLDNSGAVKESLIALPNSYDGIYEFSIKRIDNQDQANVERAFQVLSWLSLVLGPLTIEALQHALSVASGDVELHEGVQLDDNSLVSVCANLVVINPETNTIRLVHETALDYLRKIHSKKFPQGHSVISSACLAYLSLAEFLVLRTKQVYIGWLEATVLLSTYLRKRGYL